MKGLVILDFGSQYTLLIARKLRELGVYSEVIAWDSAPPNWDFRGVILSGGPASVGKTDSPTLAKWVLESKLPVLGICYGMGLLIEAFGGAMRSQTEREYGAAELHVESGEGLLQGLPAKHRVWMSHGDDVAKLPEEFISLAKTESGVMAAMRHGTLPIFGLQFHPEVKHSTFGPALLNNFAAQICGLACDWRADSALEKAIEQVRNTVGENDRVLLGVSGGVDSSVAALLLNKALKPEQVVCVMIDHGLLRKDEAKLVSESLHKAGIKLTVLERKDLFLSRLRGVTDPEIKRKIIGEAFVESFEAYAKENGPFTHLGQGTLYPDVIESAANGKTAHVIKTHHNVGGLPARLKLKLVEPFRLLFKDEVRSLGRLLRLSDALIRRHPFPGPGLAVRIPGAVDAEKIAILQEADHIFTEALHKDGLYDQVWQAATILLPVKSVGVMGDGRTYEWTCVLRAVAANDGMTAEASDLPHAFLTKTAQKIVNKVAGINRVLYDITSKPPATIEWE